MRFLVVWGLELTIDSFISKKRLSNVDLPTLGLPIIDI